MQPSTKAHHGEGKNATGTQPERNPVLKHITEKVRRNPVLKIKTCTFERLIERKTTGYLKKGYTFFQNSKNWLKIKKRLWLCEVQIYEKVKTRHPPFLQRFLISKNHELFH